MVVQKEFQCRSASFRSFEISYKDGWSKGFSFIVDSNKIYLSPQRWDTCYYGMLTDTIFRLIDTVVFKILTEKTVQSKDEGCVDCPFVAIKIVTKGDTIHIQQAGNASPVLQPLINTLEEFIRRGKHETLHAVVFLETQSAVTPPPP